MASGQTATAFPRSILEIKQHLSDPLYKNSFFIMLTSVTSAGFGFVFWMLAARVYPQEEVGIATAMISSVSMLILLSRLGLDQSVIRFFPQRDKNRVLGTAIIVTTAFALAAGIVFIAAVDRISPELTIIRSIAPLYLLFLAVHSITWVMEGAFNAIRRAEYFFLLNLLLGSRIVFIFPLVFLGALGIFSSLGISFVLGLIIATFFLFRLDIRPAGLDRSFLKDSLHFSAGNYVAVLLSTAPGMLMPIIVLNVLGAEQTASYYITYAIASILYMIPLAFSTSLFIEGSHGEALQKTVKKTLVGMFAFLVPAILALFLFGGVILGLVGESYTEGIPLLRIFALASIFASISHTYISITRVRNDIKSLLVICAMVCILLLGSAYLFMLEFGLIGLGFAWIFTYALVSVCILAIMRRKAWI